jgi:molybdopterin molybdotransferase
VQITPSHIAVLATVGASIPRVAKLPSVGIISTGDELVETDIIPGSAQIRNSNAWQLLAQVQSVPARPRYYGIAPDEGEPLKKIIDLAIGSNDVVLLTGGVSMGDFDFVPEILKESGVEILFKSVAIQPGRPTVFGRKDNTFVF